MIVLVIPRGISQWSLDTFPDIGSDPQRYKTRGIQSQKFDKLNWDALFNMITYLIVLIKQGRTSFPCFQHQQRDFEFSLLN